MKVIENYDIKNESTFRIGGKVKQAAFPDTVDELLSIVNDYDLVLGNCSNVLFSSEFINKKIIITKNINNIRVDNNKISAECGAIGPVAANEALKHSLSGFEFLVGFPGSFGGMVCMNASAHNQAIADTFVSAAVYDIKNKIVINIFKDDMKFEYRKSKLSNGDYILLNAEFELHKDNKDSIEELMNRNIEFRKNHQPSLTYGNAGSIFKNPLNDSAGRLLDLSGCKGMSEGGAKVYDKHANFIINYDNATSKDVLTLMNKMCAKVKEKYTIELKPEIKYIGDENTEEYKLWKQLTENIQMMQK